MRKKRTGIFKLKLVAFITLIIAIISGLFFLYSVYSFELHAKAGFYKQVPKSYFAQKTIATILNPSWQEH